MAVDLSSVLGFEWDAGNSRKSVEKHDVSLAEAEQVFFNDPLLLLDDHRHSGRERRYHALGRTDIGRRLLVTFTMRGDRRLVRVISVRDMNRKEKSFYGGSA